MGDTRSKAPKPPHELRLLPGLKWRGKLRILGWESDGGAVVAFDAVAPKADPQERYVFDHAVLTAKQLKDWTGYER